MISNAVNTRTTRSRAIVALAGALGVHLLAAVALDIGARPTIAARGGAQSSVGASGDGAIVTLVRSAVGETEPKAPSKPDRGAGKAPAPDADAQPSPRSVAASDPTSALAPPDARAGAAKAVGYGAQGVSAAASPSAPGADASGVDLDFRRLVQIHISKFKRFPADAGGEPIYGTVQVVFSMNRSGRVLAAAVRTSSGDARLDAEAVATIWRAEPMPEIPAPLPDQLAFIVPIDFSTNGG